ncbi:MAG: hypothetical protein H6909_02550 [Rickettsiaceae bacterium]|nr:hypothetical protein [Rickettsiaceae bacterium]
MCLPNQTPDCSQTITWHRTPYSIGFDGGKITGSVGSMLIIHAICQINTITLATPLMIMIYLFSGGVGYISGGFGGAELSKMWHQQNPPGEAVSSIPGLLGGGILGSIVGAIAGTIYMASFLASIYYSDPSKHTENNSEITIRLPDNFFNSSEDTAEKSIENTVNLPGEVSESNTVNCD